MIGAYSACKALIIGIGRYEDTQHDLCYARSDAEAIADLLAGEFGFDQIWTLYDGDATRQNIIRFFEQDLQETDEDDALLIFFAGHGITVRSAIGDDRGFLVPRDGDPKRPYANISMTTIRDDYLPMIPAKHVLLILDACYGGLALRDVSTVFQPKAIDDVVLAELTRRDRKIRQVLVAGGRDQRVLDGGLFGRSVFTGRLIEALREADPYITADHVGVHVRERVARDSIDRKHRQTPQFGYLVGGDGSFVFNRRKSRVVPRSGPPEVRKPVTAKPHNNVGRKTIKKSQRQTFNLKKQNSLLTVSKLSDAVEFFREPGEKKGELIEYPRYGVTLFLESNRISGQSNIDAIQVTKPYKYVIPPGIKIGMSLKSAKLCLADAGYIKVDGGGSWIQKMHVYKAGKNAELREIRFWSRMGYIIAIRWYPKKTKIKTKS